MDLVVYLKGAFAHFGHEWDRQGGAGSNLYPSTHADGAVRLGGLGRRQVYLQGLPFTSAMSDLAQDETTTVMSSWRRIPQA